MRKSQFSEYLERWRKGERLFSLEDLIFTNTLRVLQRKDPERWDYEVRSDGAVIRIGREWWLGLTKGEMESMTTQALTVRDLTPSQIDLIKTQIAPGINDGDLELFLAVCTRRKLDPFAKQIYAVLRNTYNPSTKRREPKLVIQTGIDGYRLLAARVQENGGTVYAGQDDPEYSPTLIDGKYPEWARVAAYRMVQGQRVAYPGVAKWTEFAQYVPAYDKDGRQTGTKLADMWENMPFNQLAKCAEAQALRKGFPEETYDIEFSPEPPVVRATITNIDKATGEISEGTSREVPEDESPLVDEQLVPNPLESEDEPKQEPTATGTTDWIAAFDGASTQNELQQHYNECPKEVKTGAQKAEILEAFNRNKLRLQGQLV
jgi:phage recombination protein Bet